MVENDLDPAYRLAEAKTIHRNRLREEAIQVAAMACRIIQELT